MISVVCLNHYSPPWFSKHHGDGMVINGRQILSPLWPLFICHLRTASSIFLHLSESPKGTGCLFVFHEVTTLSIVVCTKGHKFNSFL